MDNLELLPSTVRSDSLLLRVQLADSEACDWLRFPFVVHPHFSVEGRDVSLLSKHSLVAPPQSSRVICKGVNPVTGSLDFETIKPLPPTKEWDALFENDRLRRERIQEKIDCRVSPWIAPPSAVAESVTVIEWSAQDVKLRRCMVGGSFPRVGGGKRKRIVGFSDKSRRRLESHVRNLPYGAVGYMGTLTYPAEFSSDGKLVKKHLDKFKTWLRGNGVKQGVWFLEFQKRGAPHFHFFIPPYDFIDDGFVSKAARYWHKLSGNGDPKHLDWHLGNLGNGNTPFIEKMRQPHAASLYASKYCSKAEQKEVPDGYQHVGRFWGSWGSFRPVWNYVIESFLTGDRARTAFAHWRRFLGLGLPGEDRVTESDRVSSSFWLNDFYSYTLRGAASDFSFSYFLERAGFEPVPF